MIQLLEKSKINFPELKRYMFRIVSDSLSMTSEPCKYPETKKHFYEILKRCALTEKDVIEFSKRYWKGTKQETWNLQKDPITMFYVFLMEYSLNQMQDKDAYSIIMLFLGIRYYSNLMAINIKYCNPEYFKYALTTVFKTHLFTREGSIGGAIIHLSQELSAKYTNKFVDMKSDYVAEFITEYRTRMAQSVKKFAAIYYDAVKNGIKIKNPYEDADSDVHSDSDKTSKISYEIAKNICVYKTIDHDNLDTSIKMTSINKKLALGMVEEIHDPMYMDEIKMTVNLFLTGIRTIKNICKNDYYGYTKSLVMSKNKSDSLTFRKNVTELCLKIISNMKFIDKFESFTNQTKLSVYLFMSYYITGFLRKTICY
jgi:hypothetical protein